MSCGLDINYSDTQPGVPEETEEGKQVSRLVQATDRMLRFAQSIAGVGVWEWNLRTNTTICSLFNRELYGLDPGSEMPVGDDFLALIHFEDRQELSRALDVAYATGRYDAEFRVIWPDGRVHWLLGRGEASLDRTGHPVTITGINMDITERKRAEESVRLSESKFRSMFAGAATGMVIAEPDGTFIDVNAAFCGIVGYSREDLVSQSIWSLTHPADRDRHVQLCHELLSLDTPAVVVEKRYLQKDGQEVWVRDSSALVRSPIDGSVQILVISEDITSRKNAEEQREQHARELADKNEQLLVALLVAEEATLMKSRFLANMSHEIRTPLNGVVGMADLVLGTNLDEEQREYAEAILRSGENLRQVIDDILDISRIEAGKLKIESIPFEMLVEVEQVAQLVSISARAKGVTVRTEIDSAIPRWLSGDSMRFRQVLTNLAGNAVKFTDTGEVTIHVAVLWESKTSLAARLTVRDTGIGIDEKSIGHLFSPFFQADNSGTRKYSGTGLGLAISRQLTEMMGGEIGVESELGKGSRFWFSVVFAKTTATGDMLPAIPSAISGRKGRILLAEDNEINQRIARRVLEKAGHEVSVVKTGLGALQSLKEAVYDLVLMDVHMPEMDGLIATAEIRRLEGAVRFIPIVAMTASSMTGDRERCLTAGMDDYISKPFSRRELLELVQRRLGL